jgi:hypothetical protein
MALFQAGLEILSADPSRGALAAIGQGAVKGLGAYKGDLKDLEERRERMIDKLDTLDGLRRQEAIASEEGRRRIGQRRSQIRTEFGKEYRAMAKQFDIDIPLKAAETLADQTFRAKERQLDRVALLERSQAGAGTGGRRFEELTAAEQMRARKDAEGVWKGKSFLEKKQITDSGLTQEQWVERQARFLATGQRDDGTLGGEGSTSDPLGLRN